MDALNRPVEMIATCSPAGELCPARFRVEGADGERITVRIRKIRAILNTQVSPWRRKLSRS